MKRSTDRILVSHAGALPRPDDLRALIAARESGQPYDKAALAKRLPEAVTEVVKKQIETGIDVVNDGEISKTSFSNYVRQRFSGVVDRPAKGPGRKPIWGRDAAEFGEYFQLHPPFRGLGTFQYICGGPVKYIGQESVQEDIRNLKAALAGTKVEEAFLPAVTPGTIEHWLINEHYPSDEAYIEAISEALHEEYKAIVDAGFILQVDDPDLPDGWQMHPEMDVKAYRKFAELRIDAINNSLRGISPDRVRFHTCWGSYHGPHKYDIPLRDIIDLVLKVNAECISIEASNPVHETDYHVWEEVKLPAGRSLMPGVVGHCSDFIEAPELVAERLVRYANIVGRENVIAGTDCGLAPRVGHPRICWAKFEALSEGSRLATKRLWGR